MTALSGVGPKVPIILLLLLSHAVVVKWQTLGQFRILESNYPEVAHLVNTLRNHSHRHRHRMASVKARSCLLYDCLESKFVRYTNVGLRRPIRASYAVDITIYNRFEPPQLGCEQKWTGVVLE